MEVILLVPSLFRIGAKTARGRVEIRRTRDPSPGVGRTFINWLAVYTGLRNPTTTEKLREAFSKFGQIMHERVVTERVSGYSKEFGFVRYATIEEAAEEKRPSPEKC
ncbi:Glycine-rich RNA-binding protein 6 [Nymphaea thermarum]|nr:Glycine-rich RNA-binding protein 6 [Nymphaea thermarum]